MVALAPCVHVHTRAESIPVQLAFEGAVGCATVLVAAKSKANLAQIVKDGVGAILR